MYLSVRPHPDLECRIVLAGIQTACVCVCVSAETVAASSVDTG